MGHTIWVDVRGRSKDDVPRDNSIMLRLESQLDRLSARLCVPKLSEFYDYSELESAYGDFDGEADEPEDEGLSAEASQDAGLWFDPSPALMTVRAIYDHLIQHPEDLGFEADPPRMHWSGHLMEDLKHCQSVLETAASRGQEFRFLIVP
jgi:hypothetical protein